MSELKREAPNLGKCQSPEARAVAKPLLPDWILDMGAPHEKKIFSQYRKDGVTEYILNNLPSPACMETRPLLFQDRSRMLVTIITIYYFSSFDKPIASTLSSLFTSPAFGERVAC
jgi:hypothetical protein